MQVSNRIMDVYCSVDSFIRYLSPKALAVNINGTKGANYRASKYSYHVYRLFQYLHLQSIFHPRPWLKVSQCALSMDETCSLSASTSPMARRTTFPRRN